jgi:hypothetical protein
VSAAGGRHDERETRYGLSPEAWDAAVDEVERVLLAHARRGETPTYGELVRELTTVRLHPHSRTLPALLAEVDERTWERDGVMLAAIVRHKQGDRMRGNRFFVTAEALGRDVGEDRRAFWEAEVGSVFARYDERRGTSR